MKYTVVGGRGYIGRHLCSRIRSLGDECFVPERDDKDLFRVHLGVVYYCAGLTADFREYPIETIDAHVVFLKEILAYAKFDKLIYLSSTRVYSGVELASEGVGVMVNSGYDDHLYNISKLMGESLVLSYSSKSVVARLSNVIGYDMGKTNFIGSLIYEARSNNRVTFRTSRSSEKDYIWIDDVVASLLLLGKNTLYNLYNIASGKNITNLELSNIFNDSGVEASFNNKAQAVIFKEIMISRIQSEMKLIFNDPCIKIKQLIKREIYLDNKDYCNE